MGFRLGPRGHVRVVNTSSSGHRLAPKGGIDYTTLVPNDPQADEKRKKLGTGGLYVQSKWVCTTILEMCPGR
jgi:hypothetical protein